MMSGGIIIPNQLSGPHGPISSGKLLESPKKRNQDSTAFTSSSEEISCSYVNIKIISDKSYFVSLASWTGTSVSTTVPSPIVSSASNMTTSNYNWHSTISTPVYHPTPVAPKPSTGFSWLSPPSSTQTSPALSVISASDKEVEHVLNNQNCLTIDRLTPSPSPLPKEALSIGAQQNDEIDSFLNQITSGLTPGSTNSSNNFVQEFADLFGPEQTTQSRDPLDVSNHLNSVSAVTSPSPCTASPAPCEVDLLTVNELDEMCKQVLNGGKFSIHDFYSFHSFFDSVSDQKEKPENDQNVSPVSMNGTSALKITQTSPSQVTRVAEPQSSIKPARVIRLTKVQNLPNGVRPVLIPGVVNLNAASATGTNAANITTQKQVPVKRVLTLPRVDNAKKMRLSNPAMEARSTPAKVVAAVSSAGPSPEPSRARAARTQVSGSPKPNVALNVASDGTPIFTVQPVSLSPTPSKVTKNKTATTSRSKSRPPSNKSKDSQQKRQGTPKQTKTQPKTTKAKRKEDDAFDINSIVSKFVQRANSKKTAPATN